MGGEGGGEESSESLPSHSWRGKAVEALLWVRASGRSIEMPDGTEQN